MSKAKDSSEVFYKRVKTPTIIQMDPMECGAVALSIILGYYGLYISSEEAELEITVHHVFHEQAYQWLYLKTKTEHLMQSFNFSTP